MHTTKKPTVGSTQQVLLTYANSLLAYATQDAEFAQHFKDAIVAQNWRSTPESSNDGYSAYVYPYSQADAVSTAR